MTMIANQKAREPRAVSISCKSPFNKTVIINAAADNKLRTQVTCSSRIRKDFKITPLNYGLSFDEVVTIAAKT